MARPDGSDIDLDDLPGMLRTDAGLMLRATATAGGQIRRGLLELDRGAVARAAADGRPRGVVVAGMGGSGISGDVLLAVAGSGAPVPLQTVRSHSLPGWVGPLDVVVAVSCSGTTEETLLVAAEAARRGCRLVGVGAAGSALQQTVEAASGVHLAVDAQGLMPRASLWTLATPLLSLAAALGVATVADADLHAAADLLDEIARANGVEVPVATNEAKTLGLLLAGGWPMVWGDSALASVAAYRLACQLNENAKIPCVWGGLPRSRTTRSWRSTVGTARARRTTTCSATRCWTARRRRAPSWCCCATSTRIRGTRCAVSWRASSPSTAACARSPSGRRAPTR